MAISDLLGSLGVGGAIGKAIVSLELETTKYKSELGAAEAETKAATSSAGSSVSKFGSLASGAFAAVGVAAVAGLAVSVKAALEAQEAHERLLNSVQNASQVAQDSVPRFEAQAEAIRKTTGADDEAIVSGQALLINMGLTEDKIRQLSPLVVDLASKYDIDLQTAFKAVGKAATGSTGALSRYVGAIEAGNNPAETFKNLLDKLGGAAGFAAEQAKNEPWILLKSNFEELAESIGTAILPALQGLVDFMNKYVVPAIEGLVYDIKLVFDPKTYTDIPIIGEVFNALAVGAETAGEWLGELQDELGLTNTETKKAAASTKDLLYASSDATEWYQKNFNPTLEQTAAATKKARHQFDDLHFSVDDVATSTRVSFHAFTDYFTMLEQNSRDLRQAAHSLRDEKWINQDFIDFLSEKGPQWLIRFADLNEEKQRKWQESWEESNKRTRTANDNLDTIRNTLDKFGGGTSRHTVEIHYKYVDFDPTKPGMQGIQKQRGP